MTSSRYIYYFIVTDRQGIVDLVCTRDVEVTPIINTMFYIDKGEFVICSQNGVTLEISVKFQWWELLFVEVLQVIEQDGDQNLRYYRQKVEKVDQIPP